ncbi:MAG: radical SAM protein [Syntrophales bacterium]|jgi:radical SAM superfamily enzyme YgiQ (UPF0313 family)
MHTPFFNNCDAFYMKYEGIVIRPPSEADSLLLQTTVGCSHNRCTFCPTYKGGKFRIKSIKEIKEDLNEAMAYRHFRRVFLCDGDALIIPQSRLMDILHFIRTCLPWIERIGTYGNAKSILRKSSEELAELRNAGLGIVYLGVESGNADILKTIQKGVSYQQTVTAGRRVKEVQITLSVTVLLGIGGIEKSMEHAFDTGKILTEIDPDYASALTVMVVPGTPLHEDYISGRFVLPDPFSLLRELEIIMDQTHVHHCFFTSNHASNYLPIRAWLPEEKENTLGLIREVIAASDSQLLRPEYLRAL